MTKTILILGAGKSAFNLISYLSYNSQKLKIKIKLISDKTPEYINEIKKIQFLTIDINDKTQISSQIKKAHIVVSLLPPSLHYKVALMCLEYSVNMITASYLDDNIKSLDKKFKKKSCFLFMEMGLDPGIDHLSAKKVIDNLNKKGKIMSFESYTGGLMKKDDKNPWGYKFTWNPMNVIKAGLEGANYLKNGDLINIPYEKVFSDLKKIHLSKSKTYEGYPNRDSLKYKNLYGLENINTLIRGTLRHPGFCKAWNILINLGLTDDSRFFQKEGKVSYFDFFKHKIDLESYESVINHIIEMFSIDKNSQALKNLSWSNFFSKKKISLRNKKPSEVLLEILKENWSLERHDIDLVVMYHSFLYREKNDLKRLESFMSLEGISNYDTAMSKTVGLPIALLIETIIIKNLKFKGVLLPFEKNLYDPLLQKLNNNGIVFENRTTKIQNYP